MKKRILCYLILVILLLPFSVFAKSYDLKDMNISMDESNWYVFTRDNIKDNKELEELGITYEYLNNVMITNDVYLDACRFDTEEPANTLEVFVAIKKVSDVKNLHTYSNKDINELGEALKKKTGASSYDIYQTDKYKYVHIKYYDSATSYNIDEYYTVINSYGYTIMVQKTNQLTNSEIAELKSIVDTASFKYDASYEKSSSSSSGSSLWPKIIIGAITGGIIGGLSVLTSKNKKQESPDNNNNNNI